jgi:N-methylhydantoinase A
VQRFALGIDIGGTFTDIVVYDTITGLQSSHKELTTHDNPSRAVMLAIDRVMAQAEIPAAAIARVVHATTLFTNALIERKGAVTGLITTEGFRDTLEIGRERKFELYDITIRKPEPLVPRNRRLGAMERIQADGTVLTPLDERAVLAATEHLVREGVTSLALVFLHSYANPRHERQALEVIRKSFPKLALSASIEVAPEIREYERTSTTVANAYIKPLAERYLSTLADEIAHRGITAPLLMMLSNGGLASAAEAKRSPVQLLESGPAAGALAAATLSSRDGGSHVLAFDMGGTTAKLSVVDNGKPKIAYAFEAARQKRFVEGSGLPIRISTIELIEIGAGGGSIAHLDEIGLLKVGPESAGSEPGPAGYGRGGTLPTVTDADLLLGYLNPDYFAGGTMHIDMAAVRRALEPLAKDAGLSATEIAWGIHDIVNENMANAARVHIAEHGKDPRRYALLSTGGAGPVHACHVARKLGLRTLIVPRGAGVASALGLLVAPARVDRVATVAREVEQIDWHALEAMFSRLESEARRILAETGLDPASAAIERIADFRYVGQASELVVRLPPGPYSAGSRSRLEAAFEATYVEAFTRTPPNTPVEIINIRVTATVVPPGSARALGAPTATTGTRIKKNRQVYFPEWREHRQTPVFDRDALSAGDRIEGPAIVEERSSTLVIAPGCTAEVASSGNVIVTLGRDWSAQ